MNRGRYFWLLVASLMVGPSQAWQDDIDLNLRHPFVQRAQKDGVSLFSKPIAEVRLGRYLLASNHHAWRGGVMGNVSLLATPQVLWHMGLAQETLADGQNDIHFRLTEAYYQALTGVKWILGPGMAHVGFRHRCSHGLDNAVHNRITIRSGITASYHGYWVFKNSMIIFEPGMNWYVFGQNSDHESQPRGNVFLAALADWVLSEPFHGIVALGMQGELMIAGSKTLYGPFDGGHNVRLKPLMSARLALRMAQENLSSDLALYFVQNVDSSMGKKTDPTSSLLLGLDFLW